MGIAKSVATAEAIAEANRRAQSGEKAGESELNMSVFAETPAAVFADANANPMLDDGTDSLTDEEKKEIDKIAQLNFFEQAKSEFSFAKWPSISATLKLAAAMFFLFLFTAGFILKADEVIRTVFTDVGLIPRPDQIYDYSELQLPDNWMMDGGNQGIDGVADAVKSAAGASQSLPDL
jgi:preprotein translocase subunit SecE